MTEYYPTRQHEQAAQAIVEYFSAWDEVRAVLLICSCARGKAAAGSCVDIAILTDPEVLATSRQEMAAKWKTYNQTEPVFQELSQVGQYTHVDLDFIDGQFKPRPRSHTEGPDMFELEIGNFVAYSVPLWSRDDTFDQIRSRWLPYYDEELRRERLEKVSYYFHNNLDHIPPYVDRGLHFQAFDRLYDAMMELLQAVFIARRTYPIAYDKWIREQVVDILALPDLYKQLVSLLEIRTLESDEIARKAGQLRSLFETYASPTE